MPKDDELMAAHGYREQLQERVREDVSLDLNMLEKTSKHLRTVFPGAFDGDELPMEILRELLLARGVSESLTLKELEAIIIDEVSDPSHPLRSMVGEGSSKFDTFLSNQVTKDYRDDIEASCKELGFELRSGVSVGLIENACLQAEQQPVFLTDCSVVNITNNLYVLCHRASKLLAKSISFSHTEPGAYRPSSNIDDYKQLLLSNTELQRQWDFFFADCAYDPNSPPKGEVVTVDGEHAQSCFLEIHDAMMLFIIGHEYAHHICQHSSGGCASAPNGGNAEHIKLEHEADVVASRIVMNIGRRPENFNLFAATNVGALCALTLLDMVEKAHEILRAGSSTPVAERSSTHPPLVDRIGVIKAYMKDYEYNEKSAVVALQFFDIFVDLLDFVWSNSCKHLEKLRLHGIKARIVDDQQWLP